MWERLYGEKVQDGSDCPTEQAPRPGGREGQNVYSYSLLPQVALQFLFCIFFFQHHPVCSLKTSAVLHGSLEREVSSI